MCLIISTLSFLYTKLYFIYSTFVHNSIGYYLNLFLLNPRCLFESWHEGAALLLLLIHPAPGEANTQSMTRILMTIPAWYQAITMIVMIKIQNPTTSIFSDHLGKQWASDDQRILSRRQFKIESQQPNLLRWQRTADILRVGRPIFSWRKRINTILCCLHHRWYPIQHFNDWISPQMVIFTRWRIQSKLVTNWVYGKLQIWGDVSPLLMT
jgi:hypothetical protein